MAFGAEPAAAPQSSSAQARDYRFDGKISREVLENYLSRSVSFTELLHDDLAQPRNSRGVDPRDNIRFILNTGAKFVGRSLMCWGRERELDTLLHSANVFAAEMHKADPDIVFQGAANLDPCAPSPPPRLLLHDGRRRASTPFMPTGFAFRIRR